MLRTGSHIGGMRIDELLGRGAMGEVYRATQLSLRRAVAVKRIAEHLLANPTAVTRFEREAQCIAKVQSQHVVAVHDFGRYPDEQGEQQYLLVMELVEGGHSLRSLITGPLDWRIASSLIMQATDGLAATAEFGVVHRDIKPDNIMVTRRGVAKLADFGLAKSVDSTAMTLDGAVLGTPLYMAPEACRGGEVDARADLYSLGCTWYHLLAGRPPFTASNTMALLRAHLDEAAPDIRTLAPATPAPIAAMVMRLLAKDPGARPASALALAGEFQALALSHIILPRAVPELVAGGAIGAEAAETPATRIAEAAPGEAPTVATAPMAPSAGALSATLTAAPAALAATTTSASTAAAAPPAAIPPAPPAHPATSQPKRPLGPALVFGGVIVAISVAALALVAGHRSAIDRSAIDQAVAAGDFSLAQQRADTLLAQHPGEAAAVDAVKVVVLMEARALMAEERFTDALKQLSERHAQRPWLVVDIYEREVQIAQAKDLIAHHNSEEGLKVFAALRQRWPKDLDVCRAMVAALADHDRVYLAREAAMQLVEAIPGPLDEPTAKVLLFALRVESAHGASTTHLRDVLAKRYPPAIALMHAAILDENVDLRTNAFYLLQQAGQLSDSEALRHHLLNLTALTSSYGTVSEDALAWLTAASAKPGWAELKRSSALPAIDKVASLDEWSDHQKAVSRLLVAAFLPEIRPRLIAWATTAEEERLRWNAFTMLEQAKLLEAIDVAAFHAKTLATFDALFESPPFSAALAFFVAQPAGAASSAAKQAVTAGAAHVEKDIADYERANMASRARTCRERLAQITAALALMH